jgi:hypothetical protein
LVVVVGLLRVILALVEVHQHLGFIAPQLEALQVRVLAAMALEEQLIFQVKLEAQLEFPVSLRALAGAYKAGYLYLVVVMDAVAP